MYDYIFVKSYLLSLSIFLDFYLYYETILSDLIYFFMPLSIYNTLSREIETFKPMKQEWVKVYYCGPTPYNYAHIGNLRAYLFEDFVIRTLRFLGYRVKTVMNVTDIDDKTIRDSQKSGKSLEEFTQFYTDAFLADLGKLSIVPADTIAPISGLIEDMGKMIE